MVKLREGVRKNDEFRIIKQQNSKLSVREKSRKWVYDNFLLHKNNNNNEKVTESMIVNWAVEAKKIFMSPSSPMYSCPPSKDWVSNFKAHYNITGKPKDLQINQTDKQIKHSKRLDKKINEVKNIQDVDVDKKDVSNLWIDKLNKKDQQQFLKEKKKVEDSVYNKYIEYKKTNNNININLIMLWAIEAKNRLLSKKFLYSDEPVSSAWVKKFMDNYDITDESLNLNTSNNNNNTNNNVVINNLNKQNDGVKKNIRNTTEEELSSLTIKKYIPYEFKKLVVDARRKNPNWSIETIRKITNCKFIIDFKQIDKWESQVSNKYKPHFKKRQIHLAVYKKCIEHKNKNIPINLSMLVEWARDAKKSILSKSSPQYGTPISKSWVFRFRKSFGITGSPNDLQIPSEKDYIKKFNDILSSDGNSKDDDDEDDEDDDADDDDDEEGEDMVEETDDKNANEMNTIFKSSNEKPILSGRKKIHQWVFNKCLEYKKKSYKINLSLLKKWATEGKKMYLEKNSLYYDTPVSDHWIKNFKKKYNITGKASDYRISGIPNDSYKYYNEDDDDEQEEEEAEGDDDDDDGDEEKQAEEEDEEKQSEEEEMDDDDDDEHENLNDNSNSNDDDDDDEKETQMNQWIYHNCLVHTNNNLKLTTDIILKWANEANKKFNNNENILLDKSSLWLEQFMNFYDINGEPSDLKILNYQNNDNSFDEDDDVDDIDDIDDFIEADKSDITANDVNMATEEVGMVSEEVGMVGNEPVMIADEIDMVTEEVIDSSIDADEINQVDDNYEMNQIDEYEIDQVDELQNSLLHNTVNNNEPVNNEPEKIMEQQNDGPEINIVISCVRSISTGVVFYPGLTVK
ncbi:hypothetical protein HCN44_003212 [Aphidius gifuensis]|uniref:Uncharacterized protein n=1 Tax=Aphidius gifuensis TaxID=684658 RepID=A0A834XIN8_APHGI|nr:protein PFC0760c-like [Aphidius gifuensis]KAF7987450.1 hypothetical protein HCN44_003212 [Aphidius gifuensis]